MTQPVMGRTELHFRVGPRWQRRGRWPSQSPRSFNKYILSFCSGPGSGPPRETRTNVDKNCPLFHFLLSYECPSVGGHVHARVGADQGGSPQICSLPFRRSRLSFASLTQLRPEVCFHECTGTTPALMAAKMPPSGDMP